MADSGLAAVLGDVLSPTVSPPPISVSVSSSKSAEASSPSPSRKVNSDKKLKQQRVHSHASFSTTERSAVLMMLSNGCIDDMQSLLSTSVIPALESIVGYGANGKPVESPCNKQLVERGE